MPRFVYLDRYTGEKGVEVDHPADEAPGREATERRRFLAQAVGILAAPIAVVLGWPLVASVIGPMYRKSRAYYSKVAGFDAAPLGQPIALQFPYEKTDAYLREDVMQDVWVVKHAPGEATVFSPICPHMGCRFNWHPQRQAFVCPCHGSIFSVTGRVLGGPAPRPLDTLPHRIEGDTLWVEWERFEPGIPGKVVIS
jgi:menaquinol-cytochrome c reductase iron-sulfur subunit